MNILDICVILIFSCCIYAGWKKGLVRTLYSMTGWVLSLLLTQRIHPYIERMLTNTNAVYNFIYQFVASGLELDSMISAQSMRVQNEFISSLNLPEIIVNGLHAGNNPVLYELFKATNLTEYIYSYLTMLCINALSLILTFLVVSAIMQALIKSLNLTTKLPIIRGMNRIGGVAVGAVEGFLVVWIAGAFIVILISLSVAPWLGELLDQSMFANQFLANNIFLSL